MSYTACFCSCFHQARWMTCLLWLPHTLPQPHRCCWRAGHLSPKSMLLSSNESHRTASIGVGIVGFVNCFVLIFFSPNYIHFSSKHRRKHQEKCWCVLKFLPFFFPICVWYKPSSRYIPLLSFSLPCKFMERVVWQRIELLRWILKSLMWWSLQSYLEGHHYPPVICNSYRVLSPHFRALAGHLKEQKKLQFLNYTPIFLQIAWFLGHFFTLFHWNNGHWPQLWAEMTIAYFL